jgi:putative transposase
VVVLIKSEGRFNVLLERFSDMSNSVYSEINFHITWHTKTSLPMINERIGDRLYHYITHKILETPGARLHAVGGTETHIHIASSLQPNILLSEWVGKLKGSSSYYINHELRPNALEWQRGYGVVTFGTMDLPWVIEYIKNQKEHHKKGTTNARLEKFSDDVG